MPEARFLEESKRDWRASLTNAGDREILLTHPGAIVVPAEQIRAGEVFVAKWGSEMIGFAAVVLRTDGDSELDALFVEPGWQRNGIGRQLVEHCVAFARQRRSQALYVVGNAHVESFYAACGFAGIGVAEARFGTALRMRKTL